MIWKPAENTLGYFKAGFFGFQGSGKTYTAVKQAIFLWKYLDKRGLKPGPVGIFDTERGADFAVPEFKRHGVPLQIVRGRSFELLVKAMDSAVKEGFSIFILDSATHVWRDLIESYKKKFKCNKLSFHHWGPIKEEWAGFTDRLVNAEIHTFVLGRAGYDYDTIESEDERNGKITHDLIKTGTKFKAEGEFGFEPSIVFEMLRVKLDSDGNVVKTGAKRKKVRGMAPAVGKLVEKHRAMCVKDRNMDPETTLDGKFFDFDPGSKESAPFDILQEHLECLNIGGTNEGIDTSDSQSMFEDPDWSASERTHRRKVLIEEIQGELKLAFPGSAKADVQARTEIAKFLLGTVSAKAIERMPLHQLEEARGSLDEVLEFYRANNELPADTIKVEAVADSDVMKRDDMQLPEGM